MPFDPDYIDLDRRFLDVRPGVDLETVRRTRGFLGSSANDLTWEDLYKSRCIVVLGEAGTGKTWEFQEEAWRLTQKGEFAFFVRLEYLLNSPISEAIDAGDRGRFSEWQRSSGQAVFFLDSVDETKLREPQAYEQALNSFFHGFAPTQIHRLTVFLSCRNSKWTHDVDDKTLRRGMFLPPHDVVNKDAHLSLRTVAFAPLDEAAVLKFAAGKGMSDGPAFYRAIIKAGVEDFATRPKDVEDLILYWREKGTIDSLSQVVLYSLEKLLRERRPDQPDPLSLEDARKGARAMAAAAILGRRFEFRLPEGKPDLDRSSSQLDPLMALPANWTNDKQQALFMRPVFDPATLNSLRFYHRSVMEVLAAEWFLQCEDDGCPIPKLLGLLFRDVRGQIIVPPSLRPIVAWLALKNSPLSQEVFRRLLAEMPPILLEQGDPVELALDAKRLLLERIVAVERQNPSYWISVDARQLSRLAEDGLVPELRKHLNDPANGPAIRQLMLRIIWHGELTSCANDLLAIASNPTATKDERVLAMRGLTTEASPLHHKQQLAAALLLWPDISRQDLVEALPELYPTAMTTMQVLQLLSNSRLPKQEWTHIERYHLTDFVDAAPDADLPALLKGLLALVQTLPHLHRNGKAPPLSERYGWLANALHRCVRRVLLSASHSAALFDEVLDALNALIEISDSYIIDHDKLPSLKNETALHPALRHALALRRFRLLKVETASFHTLFGFSHLMGICDDDADWLFAEIGQSDDPDHVQICIRLLREISWQAGSPWLMGRRILQTAKRKKCRVEKLRRSLLPTSLARMLGHWQAFRMQLPWRLQSIYRHKIPNRLRRFGLLRWSYSHLSGIRQGHYPGLLKHYVELELPHQAFSDLDWMAFTSRFGPVITKAARKGFQASWRRYVPPIRGQRNFTDWRAVIGLPGIATEIADGWDITQATEQEAYAATCHAVHELNNAPHWFTALYRSHPETVRFVLLQRLSAEWMEQEQFASLFLGNLAYRDAELQQLLAPNLMTMLIADDPAYHGNLGAVLTALLNWPERPVGMLEALAQRRLELYRAEDPAFLIWLKTWLCLDAKAAGAYLDHLLGSLPADEADRFVLNLLSAMSGSRGETFVASNDPDYLRPTNLKWLIRLSYRHIRRSDDIDRANKGVYTPEARDNAQDFRNTLLKLLADDPTPEASAFLQELLHAPELTDSRPYIRRLIYGRAEQEAEGVPWEAIDVRTFAQEYETEPRSAHALYRITLDRLTDLAHRVEAGDASPRRELLPNASEPQYQSWCAERLKQQSRDRYAIERESEVDYQKKTDIRIIRNSLPRTTIEIKWAHSWSYNELVAALEDQLVGQYLRSDDCRHGILLLGNNDAGRHWEPDDGRKLTFAELVEDLKARARAILESRWEIYGLSIVSMDFTDNTAPKPKAKKEAVASVAA
jgi:hypothetical protein